MSDICYPTGTDWSCRTDGRPTPPEDATPEQVLEFEAIVERAEALAWMTLSQLTIGAIPTCPVTVRPCRQSCGGGAWNPTIIDGKWFNISCGCWDDCSCTTIQQVVLPGRVGAIEKILIDGVAVPSSAYRIDDGNKLVRTDGGSWPLCQDMGKPSSEEGTFAITYWDGSAPNSITKFAAGRLASEFYNACLGKKCALPQGVRSISRQGVSMDIETSFFENGLTGILEVDTVIRLHNPNGLKSRPRVLSPDSPKSRIVTVGRS